MRFSIVAVGCVATYMALSVHSIYGLWYLSSDLVYVILFPQLVCVVHFKDYCNTYGSLAAYIVGLFLRGAGGEDIIGLEPWIKYPFWNKEDGQLFPFRTFAMLSSFATLIGVTQLSIWLFKTGRLDPESDYFNCVVNIPDDVVVVTDPDQPDETAAINMDVKSYGQGANGQVNAGQVNAGLADEMDILSKVRGKAPLASTVSIDSTGENPRHKTDSFKRMSARRYSRVVTANPVPPSPLATASEPQAPTTSQGKKTPVTSGKVKVTSGKVKVTSEEVKVTSEKVRSEKVATEKVTSEKVTSQTSTGSSKDVQVTPL